MFQKKINNSLVFQGIISLIITFACISSGLVLFTGFIAEQNFIFLLICVVTYIVSLVVRKFVTKPNTNIQMGEIGYFLITTAFIGTLLSLALPGQDFEVALPLKFIPMLAPYFIFLFTSILLDKYLTKNKPFMSITILFLSIFLFRYYGAHIELFLKNNEFIASIIFGSPAIYMATLLFGVYNPHQNTKGKI